MIIPGKMIPQYENKYFTQIYDNVDLFVEDYQTCGIPALVNVESIKVLFYLLYAKYGNSPISNSDENQFKYKLFSIIFQHGPAWEKRLEIQTSLKDLSLEEARIGYMTINNHASNPDTAPSTQDTLELNYVNDQNVNKSSKGKVDAARDLWYALRTDVTKDFINEFKVLFLKVVRPQHTFIFSTLDDDDLEV